MTGRDIWQSDDGPDGVVPLSEEAQSAASRAAADAGMTVGAWLSQLIKYVSSMEEGRRRLPQADLADAASGFSPALTPGKGIVSEITVPVDAIRPSRLGEENPDDEQAIEACLQALAETGKFPPIAVRHIRPGNGDGASLEVVADEQRWRAARRAKLDTVPVRVQDCSEAEALVLSLREAKKHRHLQPMTEARCYLRLMRGFDLPAATVAETTGESLEHLVETLSLLSLPRAVQKMVEDGVLTRLHALALIDANDPEAIAWEVAGRGLDIYQTEQMVRNAAKQSR